MLCYVVVWCACHLHHDTLIELQYFLNVHMIQFIHTMQLFMAAIVPQFNRKTTLGASETIMKVDIKMSHLFFSYEYKAVTVHSCDTVLSTPNTRI